MQNSRLLWHENALLHLALANSCDIFSKLAICLSGVLLFYLTEHEYHINIHAYLPN